MKMHVVFFGSGPVAAESLSLLQRHCIIEAVITKPATVAEMTTVAPGIPMYTATNKQALDELITRQPFTSRLAVLIDFGIIVSKSVIDSFELGIVNSHFSVLPEWRGADPISFAILSGQKTTGVSLMLLDEGMDTGKILATKSLSISVNETTPTLTDKLIVLSDTLLNTTIPRFVSGEVTPRSQPHPDRASYSRKLTKDDGLIDWSKPAQVIEREIRAFIDWPKSRTELVGKEVIITAAHIVEIAGKPGTTTIAGKQLIVCCGQDALSIDSLKPAGKKEMPIQAFLAGYGHLF